MPPGEIEDMWSILKIFEAFSKHFGALVLFSNGKTLATSGDKELCD